MTVSIAIVSFVVKPTLLIRIVDYKWQEIMSVYKKCFFVTIYSIIIPLLVYVFVKHSIDNIVIVFIVLFIVSVMSVIVTVWYKGIDKDLRVMICNKIRNCLR